MKNYNILLLIFILINNVSKKVIKQFFLIQQKYPANSKKSLIRGISYFTIIYIKPICSNSTTLYYLTQTDPGGSLPSWLVNTVSKVIIPRVNIILFKNLILRFDVNLIRVMKNCTVTIELVQSMVTLTVMRDHIIRRIEMYAPHI